MKLLGDVVRFADPDEPNEALLTRSAGAGDAVSRATEMAVHGVKGQARSFGNRLVAQATRDELANLHLSTS